MKINNTSTSPSSKAYEAREAQLMDLQGMNLLRRASFIVMDIEDFLDGEEL